MLPPLSLYGKDHKPDIDINKGPKRRPVVGANEGPNARVSDLAARVLNQAADAEESTFECNSTESLQAKVEALNIRLKEEAFDEEAQVDERKVVIGSLDFKVWYPSMKTNIVVPVIRKRLEKSPTNIKVCDLELSIFLFVMMQEDKIKEEGLEDVLHSQKDTTENIPRLTDKEMFGGDDFRNAAKSKIIPPKRDPSPSERKRMVAIAMSLIVKK